MWYCHIQLILYIPIWWYSNETYIAFDDDKIKKLYIPIWWYSNLRRIGGNYENYHTLHSNLVIFKWRYLKTNWKSEISLHSNLVIFKCQGIGKTTFCERIFTFQSGDIQIIWWWTWQILQSTLHSNLVIFKFDNELKGIDEAKPALHSNLVIFKLRFWSALSSSNSLLHSNLVIFKFPPYSVATIHYINFTFQSGDIQIRH